jgi:hypothetical protein
LEDLINDWRSVHGSNYRHVEINRITGLDLVRLEIAIRLYTPAHGHESDNLRDLVPDFVAAAPDDR